MALEEPNLASLPADASPAGSSSRAPARRYRYSDSAASASPALSQVPSITSNATATALAQPSMNWQSIKITLGVAALLLILLYPTDLHKLIVRWISDAGWSHGLVVPLISLFFIRAKWDILRELSPQGSLVGLAFLLVGICSQILFRATGLGYMSNLSLMVVLFGATLFIFGWEHLKILWLPIAYLGFAVPPPTPLYVMATTPMQIIAAELGVQLLPLVGGEGVRSGTVIDVAFGGKHQPLNVEQACSGMRMLVAFFALAVALAYSSNRPIWQKITLAACALPIAIICNGMRVTMTGYMAVNVDPDWARGNAHQYFGLLMLGPALVLQLGIGWALDRIFIEVPDAQAKCA